MSWASYKSAEPFVVGEVTFHRPEELARETLRKHFGDAIDAAFLSRDRRQVLVYVEELEERLLDLVPLAEDDLGIVLNLEPELRLVAHQGRDYAVEPLGMARII